MGQIDTGRQMEVGTHEAPRKASGPRINARRNDLNPLCYLSDLTNCLSQVERDISSFISCKIQIIFRHCATATISLILSRRVP